MTARADLEESIAHKLASVRRLRAMGENLAASVVEDQMNAELDALTAWPAH